MKVPTLVNYLHMDSPRHARLPEEAAPGFTMRRAAPVDAEVFRRLYFEIGRNHLWVARNHWGVEDFRKNIEESGVYVHIACMNDEPAGFVELHHDADNCVQIYFLGVHPRFQGKGIGKCLLAETIRLAWRFQPRRVWLQTRSVDGEHALVNYLKRGFTITKVRPALIRVPPGMEQLGIQALQRMRDLGRYPSLRYRFEASLRYSVPGRWATKLVYALRHRSGLLAHDGASSRAY